MSILRRQNLAADFVQGSGTLAMPGMRRDTDSHWLDRAHRAIAAAWDGDGTLVLINFVSVVFLMPYVARMKLSGLAPEVGGDMEGR